MKLCNGKYPGYLAAVVSCIPEEKSLLTLFQLRVGKSEGLVADWKSVFGKILTIVILRVCQAAIVQLWLRNNYANMFSASGF